MQRLEAQLAEIDAQVARATEAYNGARWRLSEAEARIAENTRRLRTTRARLDAAREALTERLRQMYSQPTPSTFEIVITSDSITSAVDGIDLLERVGQRDGAVVQNVRSDLARLTELREELVADRKESRVQVAEAQKRREEVLAILSERRRVLENARGELGRLIREEEARKRREAELQRQRALAAQRAAAAAQERNSSSVPGGTPTTYAVTGGGENATVVGLAMQHLGVPYVWGGASPSGFDCSGLASYVYAQIGKSVPHYTGAIWAKFPKVAPGDLQPGDLVFFHADLHHMGIYIGNGQFIHAPQTGDVVKISSLAERTNYVGAVRP